MLKSLILHTGSMKTGSSALQTEWVRVRGALDQAGLVYPEADTDALAAVGRPTAGNGAAIARLLLDHDASDTQVTARLDNFLAALATAHAGRAVLLSSEWFEDVSLERLGLLKARVARITEGVRVVYLVRHVADHALALYSDRVWRSAEVQEFGAFAQSYQCPFRPALDRFAAAFGAAAIECMVYDDHRFNLVGDVLRLIGVAVDGVGSGERVNRSLSRLELEIIRRLQRDGDSSRYVTRMAAEHAYVTRALAAEDLMITTSELEHIEARAMADVRHINQTYLLGDAKLNSCSDSLRIVEHRDAHALTGREQLLVTMLEAALTAHTALTDADRPV